jgi:hypothetical protein
LSSTKMKKQCENDEDLLDNPQEPV